MHPTYLIMKTFVTAYILVVSIIIGPCLSLDCYDCTGYAQSDCADPFKANSTKLTDCPPFDGKAPMCRASEERATGLFYRDCVPAEQCSVTGCVTNADLGLDLCSYCCDSDGCNNASVADAVADALHCYVCAWDLDSPDNNTCNDPSDPNGAEVIVMPCDGECGIQMTDTRFGGSPAVFRRCFSSSQSTQCQPGCDGLGTCMTCCSENLCNGDPVTPPTMSAVTTNGAPSLMDKRRSATMSLAAISLMYMASVN